MAESGYTFDDCWKQPATPTAHRNAAISLAKTLIQAHVPFGVVTRRDLDRLSDWQVIVLPNAVCLGADEVEALRAYVENGGSLLATKHTSLVTREGERLGDFGLADVFGVSYAGETSQTVTYVAPSGESDERCGVLPGLPDHALRHPAAGDGAPGRGGPRDRDAAVHAPDRGTLRVDPHRPARHPDRLPAVVLNRYGKGTVIYCAGVIESWEHDTQRAVLVSLVRLLAARPYWVEMAAPKAVEATLFLQEDRGRFVLNLINYQQELPNIPIHDLTIRVRMDGRHRWRSRCCRSGPRCPPRWTTTWSSRCRCCATSR